MKRLMSMTAAVVLALTMMICAAPDARADSVAYVIGGWLRMRSAPSFEAVTIASFNTGTAVTVLGASGSWYYCRAANGKTGYMYSAYLTFIAPATPVTPTTSTKAWVWASNGRDVRLREGPGLSYGVLGTYSVGTSVTILSHGTYWHYIKVGKQTGYMMAQYLTTTSPSTPSTPSTPTPSGGYTAYVTSGNGKGVNLRTGAGKNYPSIGLYAVGTQVTVHQYGATWSYISIGGKFGYMMSKFLTTGTPTPPVTPTVVNSVSVSDPNPVVGETLSAVVLPSGATVSCRWYNNNGVLLGNASTYTVKNSDVGYCLMVTVTGTGTTSGAATSGYTSQVIYGTPVTTSLTGVTLSDSSPVAGQTLTASVQPAGATCKYSWVRSDGVTLGSSASYVVQNSDIGYRIFCYAVGMGSYTGTVTTPYTNPVTGTTPTQQLSGTVTLPNAAVPGVTLSPMLVLNSSNVTYNWQQNGVTVGSGSTLYVTDAMAGSDIRLTVTAVSGSGYEGQVSSNYCIIQSGAGTSPGIVEIQ